MNRGFDEPSNDGKIKRRESKLFQPDKLCMIYDTLEKGLPIKVAAEIAGVMVETVYQWLQVGKQDEMEYEEGHLEHQTDRAQFYVTCRQCIAKFMAERLGKIKDAADVEGGFNWKASAWLLEKADNELFGRKQTVTMDVNAQPRIKIITVTPARWVGSANAPEIEDGNTVEGEFTGEQEEENDRDE